MSNRDREKSASKGPYSKLVLGWQVGRDGHPSYWLDDNPKPGSQRESDLVMISTDTMSHHAIVVAQSGSGKSSFVGRLIEEVAINSKARFVVLDSNADFKMIHEIEPSSLWMRAQYDVKKNLGRLPHEATRKEFELKWTKVRKTVLTADKTALRKEPYQQLKIWWPSLSADFIAEDLDPASRNQIILCHEFTQSIGRLIRLVRLFEDEDDDSKISEEKVDIETEIETLFQQYEAGSVKFNTYLQNRYVGKNFSDARKGTYLYDVFKQSIVPLIDKAVKSIRLVSPESQQFYLAKIAQYREILGDQPFARLGRPKSITVVDLPSLSNRSDRLLAMNAILERELDLAKRAWNRATRRKVSEDRRIPTFIVVDEAHNFAPSIPENKAESVLKDQFRTIAAEGRKYGLFLILISQRPDKLDPYVISECQNKAILKIGSSSVLASVTRELGLEDVSESLLKQCMRFGKGQVLLAGYWVADEPRLMYSAARRTTEGGRNLRPEYWAAAS